MKHNTNQETAISSPITVIGAGSWGTALAILLARNGQSTRLWGWDADELHKIAAAHCNVHYLPEIAFPENLQVCLDLKTAVTDVQDILLAVPSYGFKNILSLLAPHITSTTRLAWATKGLEPQSGRLLHEVVREQLDARHAIAVLSGPNFAKDVAEGLPTATTVASSDPQFAEALAARLRNNVFRVYITNDMIGLEIGGVVKNVLAIATGIADGLALGANARAALITRGLAEMIRLGVTLGAKQETLMGLAGLGDLVLTCTDDQSRNRRFGLTVGRGSSVEQAKQMIGQVIEGVGNTAEIRQLAKRFHVDMPICEQVYQVLYENISPRVAVETLLAREPKSE